MGGETVLFRHEKTFYSPTGLAAMITDDLAPAVIEEKCKRYMAFQYERVGLNLRPELIALKCVSGDGGKFAAAAKLVVSKCDLSLVLMADDPAVMKAAGERRGRVQPPDLRGDQGQLRSHGQARPRSRLPAGRQIRQRHRRPHRAVRLPDRHGTQGLGAGQRFADRAAGGSGQRGHASRGP